VNDPAARPRPTRADLLAARGATIPDVIGPGLAVLFCGINPSLYSAAVGHHFARPGNRFWKALHLAGFTDRVLSPFEDRLLAAHGLGLTNLVDRATATAAELGKAELRAGARRLEVKAARWKPAFVAVVGVSAYRIGFERPGVALGPASEPAGGCPVWILPNPSGLNAHYQLDALAEAYRALARASSRSRG
jgi:TDG/mug DNA glycosylase family protein